MAKELESYDDIKIMEEEGSTLPTYYVQEPDYTEQEQAILQEPKSLVTDYRLIRKQMSTIRTIEDKEEFLEDVVKDHLEDQDIEAPHEDELVKRVIDKLFFGYGRLGPMMRDDMLEEIMVNGIEIPVFVYHRQHGMCESNIKYEEHSEINEFIEHVAQYVDRPVDAGHPLLDGHLIDGSRINISVAPAAPKGPAITIRKFRQSPLTIIDLIKNRTISSDLAGFLWVCVEGFGLHPCNILIAGGSGAGKTTLLNALSMFIPERERVVTVEDTLELNFDFLKNWVPLEGVPSLGEGGERQITLDVLVENTLRMRPDRVIAGEVRGREAEPLFVAMDIGLNGSMGTIHANNPKETVTRLTNKPMDVSLRMVTLLHLIVVMNRHYDREKGTCRRVTDVGEITGIEGDIAQIGELYEWDRKTDTIKRTSYPILLKEKISEWCGLSKQELNKEIHLRSKILEYMARKNIHSREEVVPIFREYHHNPEKVISKFKRGMKKKNMKKKK